MRPHMVSRHARAHARCRRACFAYRSMAHVLHCSGDVLDGGHLLVRKCLEADACNNLPCFAVPNDEARAGRDRLDHEIGVLGRLDRKHLRVQAQKLHLSIVELAGRELPRAEALRRGRLARRRRELLLAALAG